MKTQGITKNPNGTYSARVRYINKIGKSKSISKSGFKNKTLATNWQHETKLKADAGEFDTNYLADNTTVNQLVNQFMIEYARDHKINTVRGTQSKLNNYVLHPEWFDGVRVSHIDRRIIQNWVNWISGQVNTYKLYTRNFKTVLDLAVSAELLPANPFDNIRYPSPVAKQQPKTPIIKAYNSEQLATFLKSARKLYDNTTDFKKWLLLYLLASSGLRIGEALALTWDDLDVNGDVPYLNIDKTVATGLAGETVINAPKTTASIRRAYVPANIVGMLNRWRVLQSKALLQRGLTGSPIASRIFTNDELSNMVKSQLVDFWLRSVIKDSGLPRIKLHGLRASYATVQAENGLPVKVLSAQLGHTNINMTLNYYVDVTENMRIVTADTFSKAINL